MDLHSYFADPDPAVFLNAIRISLNAVCLLNKSEVKQIKHHNRKFAQK